MPGEQRVDGRRTARLVLAFHGLGDVPDAIGEVERPYWCARDRFTSILDGVGRLSRSSNVSIEITFDDGNVTDAEVALPALRDRDLTAAFFVCAGRIGRPGYLDAAAIRELATAGMQIGSHGWAHIDWRDADDTTLDQEIDEARAVLADAGSMPIDTVAIPFGSYDRRVLHRLKRAGYRSVFTCDGGRADGSGWTIPRETYTTSWTEPTLDGLATREPALGERLRRNAVGTIKRLR